jgi:hypothetical protein
MHYESFFFRGISVVNIVLALMVCRSASRYLHCHPSGMRRLGAYLVIVACILSVFNIAEALFIKSASTVGWDMISNAINRSAMLVASLMLLRRNPYPVVDADDVREIMHHITQAEGELTSLFNPSPPIKEEEQPNELQHQLG